MRVRAARVLRRVADRLAPLVVEVTVHTSTTVEPVKQHVDRWRAVPEPDPDRITL